MTPKVGDKRRPNWLLRGLVFLSLGVHLVVFLHVTGLYRSKALTYIELTVHDERPARSIPRPRHRPKPPPAPRDIQRLKVVSRPIPAVRPMKVDPAARDLPDSLVEKISVPSVPDAPVMSAADWNPGEPAAPAEFDTAQIYLEMVRLRIEREKKYPAAARRRQIEGAVTLRFVITLEGAVTGAVVAKTSGREVLDKAALRAVQAAAPFPRPPSAFFKRPISLEIKVMFELT
ncbi:MAG: TonB family protein [Thermodesulfobacteriota bacterium]|nr:TonB family protein [Thermodesulfobacteriota bacterium]